jgi:L,D-peptidoglycan transpeptidase YkuD (ErfK/YbiS/YcfS/YnhG family)
MNGSPPVLAGLKESIVQAITVFSAGVGPEAGLAAWERRKGCWQKAFAAPAVVGRGGFVTPADKREGDGATPTGVYPLGPVFGYAAEARTAMPYRPITADDCWVDDSDSPHYNTWVHGEPAAASWEEMLRPDGLYRHGIVVNYNTSPVVPGKGSAIFVHIWRGSGQPTAGCVALAEDDLLQLIAWLSPEKSPVIVLGE